MTQPQAASYCSQCAHPFEPHVVFALGEHAGDGGIVVCNVPGCGCVNTWALDALPRPALPDAETLHRLVVFAQTVRHDWTPA